MADNLADRVRQRLREELTRRKLSQQDLGDLLTWTQSKVAQKLTGRTPITLEELEALCFGVGISPVEIVRDRGLQFCADMTPTEFRTFERIREDGPKVMDALMTILDVRKKTNAPERHAGPVKKSKSSPR